MPKKPTVKEELQKLQVPAKETAADGWVEGGVTTRDDGREDDGWVEASITVDGADLEEKLVAIEKLARGEAMGRIATERWRSGGLPPWYERAKAVCDANSGLRTAAIVRKIREAKPPINNLPKGDRAIRNRVNTWLGRTLVK